MPTIYYYNIAMTLIATLEYAYIYTYSILCIIIYHILLYYWLIKYYNMMDE